MTTEEKTTLERVKLLLRELPRLMLADIPNRNSVIDNLDKLYQEKYYPGTPNKTFTDTITT